MRKQEVNKMSLGRERRMEERPQDLDNMNHNTLGGEGNTEFKLKGLKY